MRSLLAPILLLLSSCATMFNPGPDRIAISSKPPGAEIRLDGEIVGNTPATIPVQRGTQGTLVLQRAGYFPVYATLARTDNPAAFADFGWLLFPPGFIVALIVDFATDNVKIAVEPDAFLLIPVDPLDPSTPPPVIHRPGARESRAAAEAQAGGVPEEGGGRRRTVTKAPHARARSTGSQ